jgi:outer membrane lipoprotein SlyB
LTPDGQAQQAVTGLKKLELAPFVSFKSTHSLFTPVKGTGMSKLVDRNISRPRLSNASIFTMTLTKLTISLLALCIAAPNCWAQRNTTQGTVVGGVTGAVIGGLVGKQKDKAVGGAVIGGAVGAVAGGLMGKAHDNELARRDYAYQQSLYQQQQQYYQHQYHQQHVVSQAGVTTADVVSMCRSGVNDAVIMGQLQSRGVQRRLEVSDIIALHQQGVSDGVISAMQSAPIAGTQVRQAYSQPVVVGQPIYVEQPVYYGGGPVIIQRNYPRYHQHGHYHGHGIGF